MALGAGDTSFEIRGSTLRVRGELGPLEEKVFEKVVRGLMETAEEALVIDLSAVDSMSSGCVRHIALVMVWATQHGRAVTIRATRKVGRLISMGGLDKLGSVEIGE